MSAVPGPAMLLRIFVGEADHHDGQPLYHAIVVRLRERGIAGATVLRGIEGYGADARVHTTRLLRLSEDLPLVIEAVDTEEHIRAVLPEIEAMVGTGLIMVQQVEVVGTRGSSPA